MVLMVNIQTSIGVHLAQPIMVLMVRMMMEASVFWVMMAKGFMAGQVKLITIGGQSVLMAGVRIPIMGFTDPLMEVIRILEELVPIIMECMENITPKILLVHWVQLIVGFMAILVAPVRVSVMVITPLLVAVLKIPANPVVDMAEPNQLGALKDIIIPV